MIMNDIYICNFIVLYFYRLLYRIREFFVCILVGWFVFVIFFRFGYECLFFVVVCICDWGLCF